VDEPGFSGHDTLGLNSDGFFGITMPRGGAAVELLLSGRGLLVVTPVIAAALAGIVVMRRTEHRLEANVIIAVAAVYFVYNAGYWLTFGGGTPGPRFLIPALPFVAIGLGPAYRRFPATTLGLATISALFMVTASLTFPLLGENGPGTWLEFLWDGNLEHTLPTVLGVSNAYVAIVPVLAAVAAAIVLAFRATPATRIGDLRIAFAAVIAWIPIAVLGPAVAGDEVRPLDGDPNMLYLIGIAATAALAALALVRLRSGPGNEVEDDQPGELAAADAESGDGRLGRLGLRRKPVPVGVKDDAADAERA
jgi:hypothetical protein